jgi:hypothetical protein
MLGRTRPAERSEITEITTLAGLETALDDMSPT